MIDSHGPTTRGHVLEVIADMSPQTVADIKAVGLSPKQVLEFFTSKAFTGTTFFIDRKPAIILGWDKMPKAWYSWFMATPKGMDQSVFTLRRHLKQVAQDHPNTQLVCLSPQDTKIISRWFKCLGCERINQGHPVMWLFVG